VSQAVFRRLGREYGWLLAAVGLGALVLVCSIPFVSGAGPTWSTADQLDAPAQVAPPAGSAPAFVPEADGPQTSAAPTATAASPSPSRSKAGAQRRPAVRTSPTRSRAAPPAGAAPKAPVALGPDGGPMGLWQMLREYCEDRYDTWEAQLRHGTGQAENNWECRRHGENPLIDMHAACRGRYGSVAFAQFANRNDAFSWHCYRR
jgi:hypothetical protein